MRILRATVFERAQPVTQRDRHDRQLQWGHENEVAGQENKAGDD